MIQWDLYDLRNTYDGNSIREKSIERKKREINTKGINNPSFKPDVYVNDEIRSLFITDTKADNKKHFSLLPNDDINLGDELFWKEQHWLVVSIDFDDTVAKTGTIQQCNHLLKWQDYKGDIHSQWCVLERPYSSGIYEGKFISTSDKEYNLMIAYNELTRKFYTNQRFIIEIGSNKYGEDLPLVYEIITFDGAVNHYGNNKLLELTIRQCESTTQDKNSENVADYFVPESKPEIPYLDMLGNSIIGNNIKISYIDNTECTLRWEIIDGANFADITNVSDNYAKIHIRDNMSAIGKSFTLRCLINGNQIIDKKVTIKGLY